MFVTNWISTTKIQKISEITNFFRHYFLSRTEVLIALFEEFKDKVKRKLEFFNKESKKLGIKQELRLLL